MAGFHDVRAWLLGWHSSITGVLIPPNTYQANRQYTFKVTDDNVVVIPNTGNCDDLDGRPMMINIQYET